jgi:hypothetical protein
MSVRDFFWILRSNLLAKYLTLFLPKRVFLIPEALKINDARVRHLQYVLVRLVPDRVLEVGAGIGEITKGYLHLANQIVLTEGRKRLLRISKKRVRDSKITHVSLDVESEPENQRFFERYPHPFDVLICYGLLYHLSNPQVFLKTFAPRCSTMILETVVSFASETFVTVGEASLTNQAIHQGNRPNPDWLMKELLHYYKFVSVCTVTPNHEDFVWTKRDKPPTATPRMIFVASNQVNFNYFTGFSERIQFPLMKMN